MDEGEKKRGVPNSLTTHSTSDTREGDNLKKLFEEISLLFPQTQIHRSWCPGSEL